MNPSTWRTTLSRIATTALILATTTLTRADDKPAAPTNPPQTAKLETTTEKITIPNSVVQFTLVKLPPGKITMKDKDGKEKEVEIKPVWIGQTEVTWDEYDVYWLIQDLPGLTDKQRTAMRSDKEAIRSRPSTPYSPPDRGWGQSGSPAGSMFCREAKNYCEWLSKRTGHKYRIPTEAVAGGSYLDEAEDVHSSAREFYNNRKWQKHDPQIPQGRSWLADGGFVGFRIVRED